MKKNNSNTTTPTTENRGGRREGAGRKRLANPKNTMLTFRVKESTARRIKSLREVTKSSETPFVDMLDAWVEEMAKNYGIE